MKKLLLLLPILLLLVSLGAYSSSGRSMLYADSFMLHAQGSEANYWNPALLNPSYHDVWLPALNLGIYVSNNSLDLDTYNYIMDKGEISEDDKDKILGMIDDKLAVYAGSQISLFGFSAASFAITSSVHLDLQAAFSKQYLELLLRGNTDSTYVFTKEQNNLGGLSYVDLTYGIGDFKIPLGEKLQPIRAGFSLSALAGVGSGHTARYSGILSSTFEGLSLNQDVLLRTGLGGYGFKSMLGLAWDPVQNLSTGVTLDNVLGFINWQVKCTDYGYLANADSIYVSDLGNDLGDLLTNESTELEIDPFKTKLPLELRVAAMYRLPQVSFSTDYFTGLSKSEQFNTSGRLSFAVEFTEPKIMPIFLGYSMGNKNYPWRVSYGIGLRSKALEFGIGMQSFKSIIPGYKSKGLAFASFFTIRT